jgi:hypothetical protein
MKNHIMMSLFVIATGMSVVACDGGGGSAVINQCNNNPSAPGCITPAKGQIQGLPETPAAVALQKANPALGQVNLAGPNGNSVVPPNTPNPLMPGLTFGQTPSNDQILRAKAEMVASALAAQNNDPNSPYYQGGAKAAEPEVVGRAPSSSAAPGVDSSIASETSSMDGKGEASR